MFGANKKLAPPWDYNYVVVVAPAGAAGLGDFKEEADRLADCGVCMFEYRESRFQGEGAAKEIADTIAQAQADWMQAGETPDALVIIRGGGAVNDLAWLNDYDLARTICDLPVPVLTGIGHERDSCLLDEVAHTKYDTPSKVVHGIEQCIVNRAREAKQAFEEVVGRTNVITQRTRSASDSLERDVIEQAQRHLALAKQRSEKLLSVVSTDALKCVRLASDRSKESIQTIKTKALTTVTSLKQDVPATWRQISVGVDHAVQRAKSASRADVDAVLGHASNGIARAKQIASDALDDVVASSRQQLRDGASKSQALMREVAGQGPEKTLSRGFALVRDANGNALMRAADSGAGAMVRIEFQDGALSAQIHSTRE